PLGSVLCCQPAQIALYHVRFSLHQPLDQQAVLDLDPDLLYVGLAHVSGWNSVSRRGLTDPAGKQDRGRWSAACVVVDCDVTCENPVYNFEVQVRTLKYWRHPKWVLAVGVPILVAPYSVPKPLSAQELIGVEVELAGLEE